MALPRVVNYIIGVSLVALGMAVMLVLRMGMSATALDGLIPEISQTSLCRIDDLI